VEPHKADIYPWTGQSVHVTEECCMCFLSDLCWACNPDTSLGQLRLFWYTTVSHAMSIMLMSTIKSTGLFSESSPKMTP